MRSSPQSERFRLGNRGSIAIDDIEIESCNKEASREIPTELDTCRHASTNDITSVCTLPVQSDNPEVIVVYHDVLEEVGKFGRNIVYGLQQLGFPCSSHQFESTEVAADVSGWLTRRLPSVKNIVLVCTQQLCSVFDGGGQHYRDEADQHIHLAATILKGILKTSTQGKTPQIIPVVRTHDDVQFVPNLYKLRRCFLLESEWEAFVRLISGVQEYERPPLKDRVVIPTLGSSKEESDVFLSRIKGERLSVTVSFYVDEY